MDSVQCLGTVASARLWLLSRPLAGSPDASSEPGLSRVFWGWLLRIQAPPPRQPCPRQEQSHSAVSECSLCGEKQSARYRVKRKLEGLLSHGETFLPRSTTCEAPTQLGICRQTWVPFAAGVLPCPHFSCERTDVSGTKAPMGARGLRNGRDSWGQKPAFEFQGGMLGMLGVERRDTKGLAPIFRSTSHLDFRPGREPQLSSFPKTADACFYSTLPN